jgi:hypothetical protein
MLLLSRDGGFSKLLVDDSMILSTISFLICLLLSSAEGMMASHHVVQGRLPSSRSVELSSASEGEWEKISDIVTIESPWLSIMGERLRDNEGKILDYWRVEKSHSAVVVTIQKNRLLFPKPSYRPGLGYTTLDFPGGRVPADAKPVDVVPAILKRELGIQASDIYKIESLNERGWPVNSSFSNQLLFGFVATLNHEARIDSDKLHTSLFTIDQVDLVLQDLLCLQCRSVLMEFLLLRQGKRLE